MNPARAATLRGMSSRGTFVPTMRCVRAAWAPRCPSPRARACPRRRGTSNRLPARWRDESARRSPRSVRRRDADCRGRALEQQRAGLRAGQAHSVPESCIDWLPEVTPSLGLRRRGRGTIRIALEGDIEFLGGDLRQRRDDALPQFDLAGRDAHGPAARSAATATTRIVLEAAGQRPRRRGTRLMRGLRPTPPPRAARRARCGCGCRSGTDSCPAPRGFRPRWARDGGEQRRGADHDAACAVAALRGLLVDEGLLQRMQASRGPSPSTVTMSLPAPLHSGVSHEATARPSIMT